MTGKINRISLMILAFTAILLTMNTFAFAEEQADRQERRLEMMKQRLELTDGQVNEIRAIMESARLEAERDREKYRETNDREGAREAMEVRRKTTEEKIGAILNDKQKEEFDKMKDEMGRRKDRSGERPGGRRGGGKKGGRRGMGR